MARQIVGENPLIAAKGLTQDLLAVHSLSLSQLMHEVQQPGVLLDEDSVPHKLILERISVLQKDIISASHALLKLEAALFPEKEKTASRSESSASTFDGDALDDEAETLTDISTIVLQLVERQKQ